MYYKNSKEKNKNGKIKRNEKKDLSRGNFRNKVNCELKKMKLS